MKRYSIPIIVGIWLFLICSTPVDIHAQTPDQTNIYLREFYKCYNDVVMRLKPSKMSEKTSTYRPIVEGEFTIGDAIKVYNLESKLLRVIYPVLRRGKLVGLIKYRPSGELEGFRICPSADSTYPPISMSEARNRLAKYIRVSPKNIPNPILIQSGVFLYWKFVIKQIPHYICAMHGEVVEALQESSGLEEDSDLDLKMKEKSLNNLNLDKFEHKGPFDNIINWWYWVDSSNYKLILKEVPYWRQHCHMSCGCATTQVMLAYYNDFHTQADFGSCEHVNGGPYPTTCPNCGWFDCSCGAYQSELQAWVTDAVGDGYIRACYYGHRTDDNDAMAFLRLNILLWGSPVGVALDTDLNGSSNHAQLVVGVSDDYAYLYDPWAWTSEGYSVDILTWSSFLDQWRPGWSYYYWMVDSSPSLNPPDPWVLDNEVSGSSVEIGEVEEVSFRVSNVGDETYGYVLFDFTNVSIVSWSWTYGSVGLIDENTILFNDTYMSSDWHYGIIDILVTGPAGSTVDANYRAWIWDPLMKIRCTLPAHHTSYFWDDLEYEHGRFENFTHRDPYSYPDDSGDFGVPSYAYKTFYYNIIDVTPPTPDPMTWNTEPYQTSISSISMVASTASDPSGPVYYHFNFYGSPTGGSGGSSSAWQTSTSYTDGGLQTNHQYGYRVKARDDIVPPNQTDYSSVSYVYTDIEKPTGIAFGTITETSIQLRSSNTPSGLTRGNSGLILDNITNGHSSGWKQNNNWWTDSPLSINTRYGFRAQARNGDGDQTGYCEPQYRYTLANPPGIASFSNVTATRIRANWTPNGNPSGTEYYCQNVTTGAGSGWITDTHWDSEGLSPNTSYSFQVKARNGDYVETAPVYLGSKYTLATPPINVSHNNTFQTETSQYWTWESGGAQKDFYAYTITPSANSGWTPNTHWNQGGLSPNTQYTVYVKTRNEEDVETDPVTHSAYTSIEEPTGITFGTINTVSIEARSSNTPSNLTVGSSGLLIENSTTGASSGWKQDNNYWISSGLTANNQYGFRAKARNGDGDETGYCDISYRYTLAHIPNAPIVGNPTTSTLDIDVDPNGNPAWTEYAIRCTETTPSDPTWLNKWVSADGSPASEDVWQTDGEWDVTTITGLSSNTTYSFRVKAKNGDEVETELGPPGSGTTQGGVYCIALSCSETHHYIGDPAIGTQYDIQVTNCGEQLDTIDLRAYPEIGMDSMWGSVNPEFVVLNPSSDTIVILTVQGDPSTEPGDYSVWAIGTSRGDLSVSDSVETITTVEEGPVLYIYPDSLNFGDTARVKCFSISNVGSGTLIWKVEDPDQSWITSVTPDSGTNDDTVLVTVDRCGLTPGDTSGLLTISSNAETLDVTVAMSVFGLPVSLMQGWNMISTSLDFCGDFPSDIIYTWDCEIGDYITSDVVCGKGYWVPSISDATFTLSGARCVAYVETLCQGWNMIGSVASSVYIYDMTQVVDNPQNSIVRNAVYWWDPSTTDYVLVDSLSPGKGYWVASVTPCTLTVSESPAVLATKFKDLHGVRKYSSSTIWELEITVTSDNKTVLPKTIRLGEVSNATNVYDFGLDLILPPRAASPVALDVSLILKESVFNRLARDFREPNGANIWRLNVRSDSGFTLSWDTSSLPSYVNLSFSSGDRAIAIKEKNSFHIGVGGDYLFEILSTSHYRMEGALQVESVVNSSNYQFYRTFPNPFKQHVEINYSLLIPGHVTLRIYNIAGELVRTLVNHQKTPGYYKVIWDGKDEVKQNVPSGIYLCILETQDLRRIQKLVLIR